MWRNLGARASPLQRVGRQFSMPCKHTSWWHAWAVGSDKSRNVAPLSSSTINMPSHLTLQHANSA
jgi:hypothetical protein